MIQHGGHIRSVPDFLSLHHGTVIMKKPSDETWVQSGLIFSDSQFMRIINRDLTFLAINLDLSQPVPWFYCLGS